VALERQSIEKKDFPIGRRGYDPEAVDAHLSSLADEIEELRVSSRRRTETVASAASDHVRAIVDAAEKSAADIQRQAEADAQETRAEAAVEAQSTRERATAQAREYVGKVSEATNVLLQRLDAMESELNAMIESLRTGANRLTADLQLLETDLGDVKEASGLRPRFEPEARAATGTAADGEPPVEPERLDEAAPVAEDDAAEPAAETAAGAHAAAASDDTEGARLIALNMALNGTPRDETDRYLAENFTLSDRGRLIDEVYASVEG
jgi:DivIVA domain-containing protein